MCRSMVDIKSPTAEIRRGKKERKKQERNYRMKILWSALLHRATIIILGRATDSSGSAVKSLKDFYFNMELRLEIKKKLFSG